MSGVNRILSYTRLKLAQPPVRPLEMVTQVFCRNLGVKLSFLSARFLTNLPRQQYDGLAARLREYQAKNVFDELVIDPPDKLKNFRFAELPDDFLAERLDGLTLDLTNLKAKFAAFLHRPAVSARIVFAPPAKERPGLSASNNNDLDPVVITVPGNPDQPVWADQPVGEVYDLVAGRNVMRQFRRFEIGTLINPAKLLPAIKKWLVSQLNWLGRDPADMRRHVVEVDETMIAFEERRPVAFATIDELPYVYTNFLGRKSAAQVAPLVGTAVRPEYQRQGLQVKLNYLLLARRWIRYKFTGGLFKPFWVGTRTQNPIVIASLYRYFQGVRFSNLSATERAARDVLASYFNCAVDEEGIVKDAYDRPIGDEEQTNFRPRVQAKIDRALAGLGEKDARIFIFKITAVSFLKSVCLIWWKKIFH